MMVPKQLTRKKFLILFFVSVGAKLASKFTSDTTKINPPVSRQEFRWTHIETKSVEKITRSRSRLEKSHNV